MREVRMKNKRIVVFITAGMVLSTVLCGCSVSISEPSDNSALNTTEETAEDTAEESAVDAKDIVLSDLPTKWDLTELFEDEAAFEADMQRVKDLLPEIESLRGTLKDAEGIRNYLENPAFLEANAILAKASLYTTSLINLNASDPWARKAKAAYKETEQELCLTISFVEPEIMEIPFEKRREIFADERLAPYRYYMRKYTDPLRVTLSEEADRVETIMETAATSKETWNVFENVDLPRLKFTYPDGTEGELRSSAYTHITKSRKYDHEFRKEIFELLNDTRKPYINTYASFLEGTVRKNWAKAQIRGFDSTLAYALHESDVDPAVYDRIIEFAHSMIPKFNEYYNARKELLGLDEMMECDMSVPVTDYEPQDISYEDAVNLGRSAVSVWGDFYLSKFDRQIRSHHIDVYPAEKKKSGAYNHLVGNETLPYILYNFNGTPGYTSTIVHEMGHAIYSALSTENQNIYNCDPGIFTQEVASTANEAMFNKYMIKNASSRDEKLYWLGNEINRFSSNLQRQAMLSEFEDYCYKTVEGGGSLTASEMSDKWLELNKQYYGLSMTIPDDYGTGWARSSGLYNNYYIYKYATSVTYSASICDQVDKYGRDEIDAYLNFLKAGNTASPAELLRIANVDPMKDETYEAAGNLISDLIDEYIETASETD